MALNEHFRRLSEGSPGLSAINAFLLEEGYTVLLIVRRRITK
jgi:hypothetical protein